MIITLNMDTEEDKEVCKKVLELVLDFGGTVDLEVCGKPREVNDLFEAARLRTAGEKVVYSEKPKKRGRPRKDAMTRKILTAASACIVTFATSKYFCGDSLGALFWMSVASTTLIVATGPKE